jgi:uncharacterized protein YjbI with pentapeptide repeats
VVLDGYAGSWLVVGSSLVGYDGGQYVREEDRRVPREPQTITERALLLLRATLVPGWSPTASQGLVWAIRGGIVLGVLVLIASAVDKTLWDWLKLLIVPLVLAVGGYLFNSSQNRATQEAAEHRAQDDTLQAYLDGMAQLLTDENRPLYRAKGGDRLSTVARARTLTVLTRLDGARKRSVLQFLYESGLIARDHPIVKLRGSDLSGAYLSNFDLRRSDLSWLDLRRADLDACGLAGADLTRTQLCEADLTLAHLDDALLVAADLRDADLNGAGLRGADLSYADLRGANLHWANLEGALGLNDFLLSSVESLEGATMPDGQILKGRFSPDGATFEEWLKSKGRGEDGENSAPS